MADKYTLNDKDLRTVNGGTGEMVGMSTPLGEYAAEDLIAMYNNDPAGAVSYIHLAKLFCPGLAEDFRRECEEKGLTIPEDLDKLLG